MHCDIVLLVDQETGHRARGGEFIVDSGSVESQVLRVLRQQHNRVAVVPYDPDTDVTIAELRALNPRLVFNLTEWIDGDRSRDHVITRWLEKLGFPYTGTAGDGLRLARDVPLGPQSQDVGERESTQAQRAGPQKVAPADVIAKSMPAIPVSQQRRFPSQPNDVRANCSPTSPILIGRETS